MREPLRTVRLTPYRTGHGPTFTLRTWDTGRTDHRGQSYIAYELRASTSRYFITLGARRLYFASQAEAETHATQVFDRTGSIVGIERTAPRARVLFAGEDFAGSPLHADDSDQTIASLLAFLTLRPGDTDREYFAEYTPAQWAFVDSHADALSAEVSARFGDN